MGRKRNITLKEKQVTDLWLYNFGDQRIISKKKLKTYWQDKNNKILASKMSQKEKI